MKFHQNKYIQASIEYALSKGWIWIPAGKSAHCFCRLRCGDPSSIHQDHQMSISSTPRNAENHAKQIRRNVDRCI